MNEPIGRELTTGNGVSEPSRRPTARCPGKAEPTIHCQTAPTAYVSTSPKRRILSAIRKPVLARISAVGALLFFSLTQTKPAKTNPPAYWRIALELAHKGAEEAIARLLDKRGSRREKGLDGLEFVLSQGWASGEATGSCHVKVEGPDRFTRVIDSTATVRNLSRTVARRTVRVEMRRPALFESGLLAREELLVEPGVELSSYDSREATRTFAGEGGGKGAIRGDEEDMPLILPPWRLAAFPAIDLSNGDALSVHESGTYPHVMVGDSSTLIIAGDASIYVVGSLIIRENAKVVIGESVRNVAFYVEKDVAVEKGAAVMNLSGRPSGFAIYGMDRSSSIGIESQHPFVGTIYAPHSEVTIGPGVNFFGAVCGRRVRVSRGATICYDEELRSIPSAWRRFAVVSREEL